MDAKLVCPCGLTCCDCLFYRSEIYETARRLRDLIKNNDLDFFLNILSPTKNWQAIAAQIQLTEVEAWEQLGQHFDRFKDMATFLNVLDGIIQLQCKATCQETGGCSVGGNTHECKAVSCVKAKGYQGCWQCDEFESCDKLQFLKGRYGFVIEENLRTARDKGVEAVQSHGNRYYGWQRRKYGEN